MTTKREIIKAAFEQIGLASYTYDLEVEELVSALKYLDNIALSLDLSGLNFGYNAGNDIDAESNIPAGADLFLIMSLANILSASYGKALTPDQKSILTNAQKNVEAWSARNNLRPVANDPRMPLGAGRKNSYLRQTFQSADYQRLEDGNDY